MSRYSKVPTELKQRHQWVCWKYVTRDGKATKVPFMPSGVPASSTDPESWSTLQQCVDAAGYEGVGFVFEEDGPFVGIDIDGCRDPDSGTLEPWAKEVVVELGTYAEVSPSKTGVKMIGMAEARWPHRNNVKLPQPKICSKDPGIEVYDAKRFFCITGIQLRGMNALAAVDEKFDWLADRFSMRHAKAVVYVDSSVKLETPILERAARYLEKLPPSISGQAGHNACFHAACVLVMGFGLDENEAYRLLAGEFNGRCNPPWSERELRHKIAQAQKQPGSRNYLRDAEPAGWDKIRIPSSYRELKKYEPPAEKPESDVRKTTLKSATAAYMSQLASGKQVLVATGIPKLDYAVGGGFAFGEMVIIAARPSHGKSAVGLQMTHAMSAAGLPVAIVSEEMSALALGKRTIQFAAETPEINWQSEFEDVCQQLDSHFRGREDVTILESCGSVERAVAEIEELAKAGKCKVALVDYAQLLDAKGKDRYERISRVSQTLRMLASRLQIVVLVLAQLNREIESRKTFTPMMSDIKETGQLEQDADVIIFGVWPYRINASNDQKNYQFYICKNRNREIRKGAFECEFNPARQKLLDPVTSSQFENDF